MPNTTRDDLIRISVRGAGRRGAADSFSRVQRDLQDSIIATMRELELEATAVLAGHAPADTEDLRASLEARFFFRGDTVRFTISGGAPGHGGDPSPYIGVTRRGHREQRIHPSQRRALKVHLAGHRSPHIFVFRAWVTGVGHPHPSTVRAVAAGGGSLRALRKAHRRGDWVDDAEQDLERIAAIAERRLGRRVEVSVR